MRYQGVKTLGNPFLLLVFFLYLHSGSAPAFCAEIYVKDIPCEKYYIDEQNVFLLYKIVNWWYDCLPKDDYLLCGKSVKCTNLGNACIAYTQSKSALEISVQNRLAGQLSIFKTCDGCFGPSFLRCVWQNEKYLGKGKAVPAKNLTQFVFLHIDEIHARVLTDIEKQILFVVQGNIRGLTNDGKIALHNTGAVFKKCPGNADDKGGVFPITVKMENARTGEVIARYIGTWSN